MEAYRYDFAQLKATRTDEGFIIDSPVVGRVGVQVYRNKDGTMRRELRLPEEVFKADALASAEGKPITDDHPPEPVNPKNFKKYAIGTMTGAAIQDGDAIRVPLVIHDETAIDKATKGGKRELSLGYKVDLDETPGTHPEYGDYDAIQRNIRINHLALVGRARAGSMARLNLDRADAYQYDHTEVTMSTDNLGRIRLDSGLEYQAAPEVIVAVEKLRNDHETVTKELADAKTRLDTLAGERDTLKAQVEKHAAELEKVRADALEAARAEIKERADVEKVAATFKVDCADLTTRQIKEAVIKAVRTDADLTGKSDEYINAAYDTTAALRGDKAMEEQRKATGTRNDGGKPTMSAAEKYAQFRANGFKTQEAA
jgi:hypothetical protein